MGKRKPIDYDEMFPEDIEQYYKLFYEYTQLTPEDYTRAYNISQRALALADRWSDLAANSVKLAASKGYTKTDLSGYCYRKYRQMQLIHEHCRSIWKTGEDEVRVKTMIKGRRD